MPSASESTMMKVVPGCRRHHTRREAGVLQELTQEGPDSRHGRSPSIDVAARIRERRH